MKLVVLVLVCGTYIAAKPLTTTDDDAEQSCDSPVYCRGDLLDVVQRARIFNDSKTFVDMSQKSSTENTMENFKKLMKESNNNPTKEQIAQFVNDNFRDEDELESWNPNDFNSDPEFLETIEDVEVREFARSVVAIWPSLARKVKNDVSESPERHSLISVPNGFIIPGGRFRELYYWDSYWIVKGLLLSEMQETVRGMLENLLSLVERYGFVPNGSRVYYLNRSQPPLLAFMVNLYMEAVHDKEWLGNNIGTLEKELEFWLKNKTTVVEKDGNKYVLAHYISRSGTPRPESYREDLETCEYYGGENEKKKCYAELKSGAETGWDYSSRWLFDENGGTKTNLSQIATRRVIPVDLNSYLCKAFKLLSDFHATLGNAEKSIRWLERSETWRKSIELVLYDEKDGIWYDYDVQLSQPRKMFFPSNFAPLWTQSYDVELKGQYGNRAANYFNSHNITETYNGGIPTSIDHSGEQWDLPNAWPPLQEIIILGLHSTGDKDAENIAQVFARRWVEANMRGYKSSQEMYEKYDAMHAGQYGGGGEYTVQAGFGWTNGAVLSLIDSFYSTVNSRTR